MSNYMKGHFPFLGIKSPQRVLLMKEWFKTIPTDLSSDEKWLLITELWNKKEREFQYVAIDYLNGWKKDLIRINDISEVKFLITNKSWWDSVDAIASNFLGKYFLKYPEQVNSVIEEWRHSDNMWIQRSCLLYQLKYKDRTDFKLLMDLIRQYQPIKEFFVQKAIGWTLRQYSKTAPEAVRLFIDEIQLKGLAAKEASKYL